MTMTPSLVVKPSISTSSWLSVCSRSSWPPPRPVPRWRPTASISSMNMMAGATFLACSNRSRTRDAPTPTYSSTKSEPEMDRNCTPASPATALGQQRLACARRADEQHALGDARAHLGNTLAGFFRNSTISCSSSFSSSAPATSANVTFFCFSSLPRRVRALENLHNAAGTAAALRLSESWSTTARP